MLVRGDDRTYLKLIRAGQATKKGGNKHKERRLNDTQQASDYKIKHEAQSPGQESLRATDHDTF